MARPRLPEPEYRLACRNGVYYVTWTEAGRSRRITTGCREEAAAKVWRRQFIAEQQAPFVPASPTIGTILDGYIDDRRGIVASIATLEHAAKPLRRALGDLLPEQVTMAEGRRYARQRRLEGRKDGTIIREIVTLRAALSWAVRRGWTRSAPYVEAPAAPRPRDRWLSVGEAARLLRACPSRHLRLFVRIALYTAARTGAILELEWSKVDLARGRIDFTLPGRQTNKRRVVVPISPKLAHVLRRHRAWARTDRVIEYGGEAVASVKKAFARAVERSGIPPCGPHDLRRTAATWMVERGVPLAEVARYLGDSEKMVERVYGRHGPAYLAGAVAALGRFRANGRKTSG